MQNYNSYLTFASSSLKPPTDYTDLSELHQVYSKDSRSMQSGCTMENGEYPIAYRSYGLKHLREPRELRGRLPIPLTSLICFSRRRKKVQYPKITSSRKNIYTL